MLRAIGGLRRLFRSRPHGRRGQERRPALERLEDRSLQAGGLCGCAGPFAPGYLAGLGGYSPGYGMSSAPVQTLSPYGLGSMAQNSTLQAFNPYGLGYRAPNAYIRTNIISDLPVGAEGVNAPFQDPRLVNPWGLAMAPNGPFWVADQLTGVSTIYSTQTGPGPVITIPPPSGGGKLPLTGPTGIVYNGTNDFKVGGSPATFLFATLDGTIAAWNPGSGTTAQVVANLGPKEEFTGLAMAAFGNSHFLYTADPRFHNGIDIFDANFHQIKNPNAFVDPFLPAGFSPYNIQNIGGVLLVTYTTPASGGGYVDAFTPTGLLIRRIAGNGSGGPLQSPWGLAVAPPTFGRFANDLLVGNFGDGRINAYNAMTGRFDGQLTDLYGNPIVIPFLWGLSFGNGHGGGSPNALYFTAGIAGQFHGLFGSIQAFGSPAYTGMTTVPGAGMYGTGSLGTGGYGY